MSETLMIDPRLFNPEAVTPETTRFNERLAKKLDAMPPTHTLPPGRDSGSPGFGPIHLGTRH